MDGAWWMLLGSTISFDLGKYTIIIDDTNFMAASENYLCVWTTVWPEFTFRKMMFLMVLPTSSIGISLWCPSLQNQYNDWFKNIVPANSWKINLDPNWVPIPSLHRTISANDLLQSISTVSLTFWDNSCYSIMVWVFSHHDYTCFTFRNNNMM